MGDKLLRVCCCCPGLRSPGRRGTVPSSAANPIDSPELGSIRKGVGQSIFAQTFAVNLAGGPVRASQYRKITARYSRNQIVLPPPPSLRRGRRCSSSCSCSKVWYEVASYKPGDDVNKSTLNVGDQGTLPIEHEDETSSRNSSNYQGCSTRLFPDCASITPTRNLVPSL